MIIKCDCGGILEIKRENGNDIPDDTEVQIGFDLGDDNDNNIFKLNDKVYVKADNIKFFIHCNKCDTTLTLE